MNAGSQESAFFIFTLPGAESVAAFSPASALEIFVRWFALRPLRLVCAPAAVIDQPWLTRATAIFRVSQFNAPVCKKKALPFVTGLSHL
jgi:hypothetical protein